MDVRSRDDLVRTLLSTHSTVLADVDPSRAAAPRLLVRSDASGTFQLCELNDGTLNRLTDLPEPVTGAHYIPGARRACSRSTPAATSAASCLSSSSTARLR